MIKGSIYTRYYLITKAIPRKEVELKYVKTQDQVNWNIFMKSLKFEEFQRLKAKIGVKKKLN